MWQKSPGTMEKNAKQSIPVKRLCLFVPLPRLSWPFSRQGRLERTVGSRRAPSEERSRAMLEREDSEDETKRLGGNLLNRAVARQSELAGLLLQE